MNEKFDLSRDMDNDAMGDDRDYGEDCGITGCLLSKGHTGEHMDPPNPEPAKEAQAEGPVTAEMVSAALRDTSQLNFGVERWFLIRDHINAALAHAGQPAPEPTSLCSKVHCGHPLSEHWDDGNCTHEKCFCGEFVAGQPAPSLLELVREITETKFPACIEEEGFDQEELETFVIHIGSYWETLKSLAALGHSPNTVKASTLNQIEVAQRILELFRTGNPVGTEDIVPLLASRDPSADKGEVKRLREALYACIVELEYVQSVENCGSGLCASAKGKELIEKGMRLLGVKDLSAETLASAAPQEGEK